MPGPSKGYVSKKDPRREDWDRLQNTPAGGDSRKSSYTPDSGGTSSSSSSSSSGRSSSKPRRKSPPKPPRARRNPLSTPKVQSAVESLRERYTDSGRTAEEARRQSEGNAQLAEDRLDRIASSEVKPNLTLSRTDFISRQNAAKQNTSLKADGSTVERYRGRKPVGRPRVGETTRAAREGKIKRDRDRFTTPEIRQTRRKVRRARREVRRARAALQTPRKNLMRAGLSPEQAKILTTVLKTGRKMGASQKEMLAAVQTALVESNISNPTVATDHDSLGWRQERQMYYDNPTNVKASAGRFFQETAEAGRGAGMTAGQLAQSVQRSAYPDKYDQRTGEAQPLLEAFRSAGNASPEAKARLDRAEQNAKGVAKRAGSLGLSTDGLVTPNEAKNLGIKPPEESGAPPKIIRAFKGMIAAAKALEAQQLPYVWGGGHGTERVGDPAAYGGLDCSSTVSHILQQGGVDMPTIVSGDFGSYTKPGPGAVTILYNPEHVLMKIGDKYFGTSGTNPGGGPGWIDKSVGDSEMASGKYNIGHVPGLGPKIAKQMNLDPDSYRVFPGMTVDGNTATVTSGGTVSYSPTFSNSPIVAGDGPTKRKTRQQRIIGQLRDLGYRVDSSGITKIEDATKRPEETLSELKERYGIR